MDPPHWGRRLHCKHTGQPAGGKSAFYAPVAEKTRVLDLRPLAGLSAAAAAKVADGPAGAVIATDAARCPLPVAAVAASCWPYEARAAPLEEGHASFAGRIPKSAGYSRQ